MSPRQLSEFAAQSLRRAHALETLLSGYRQGRNLPVCERFDSFRSHSRGRNSNNDSKSPFPKHSSVLGEEENDGETRDKFVHDSLLHEIEKTNAEGRIRPSVTVPLWKISGYAIGTGSRLLNSSAIDGIFSLLVTDACEDGIRRVIGRTDGDKGITSDEKDMIKFFLKKQRDDRELVKLAGVMEQMSGPLSKGKGQRIEGLKSAFRGVCRIPEIL